MKKKINTHKNSRYKGVPFYIIWIGKILQFFSIKWATKYAQHLFITPIRFTPPKREEAMYFGSKRQLVTIPKINKEIMVYKYGNSVKKVLLVHGWSGRGTQMSEIAEKLIYHKYMVVSFDGPAHGKSTGKTTHMREFIATIKVINEKFGPFEFAVGHSLGAMAILNGIKEDGLNVKKAIVIGAGDIITDIIKNFIKQLQLKNKVAIRLKRRLDRAFNGDIDINSASEAAKSVQIPVLVIHDTDDRDVAVSCGKNIHEKLKNSKIIITNGLGHRRILRDSKVIDEVYNFIRK